MKNSWKKTEVNHCALWIGKAFLDITPKVQVSKDKMDFIKIKNLSVSKDTIKRVKRQPRG